MEFFKYQKVVQFHETDLAGVVHHSNFLKYFEEARVDWLRQNELMEHHTPHGDVTIAVLETGVQHLKPAYCDDQLDICLQVRPERLKIRFQYVIYSNRYNTQPIATGFSLHFPVNREFKPCRLPAEIGQQLEKEAWTEVWPLNLSE